MGVPNLIQKLFGPDSVCSLFIDVSYSVMVYSHHHGRLTLIIWIRSQYVLSEISLPVN
jgi:hypothetical protein